MTILSERPAPTPDGINPSRARDVVRAPTAGLPSRPQTSARPCSECPTTGSARTRGPAPSSSPTCQRPPGVGPSSASTEPSCSPSGSPRRARLRRHRGGQPHDSHHRKPLREGSGPVTAESTRPTARTDCSASTFPRADRALLDGAPASPYAPFRCCPQRSAGSRRSTRAIRPCTSPGSPRRTSRDAPLNKFSEWSAFWLGRPGGSDVARGPPGTRPWAARWVVWRGHTDCDGQPMPDRRSIAELTETETCAAGGRPPQISP